MRLIRLLKNDLARETAQWVGDDVISQTQAERICERYGVDYHQAQSGSLGYNVLVGLGYLFIGLAVITLLSANWDDIPRAVRMGGLVILTLATQSFAVSKYLSNNQTGASGLFLLGNIFFGASIILIAQIYHLGEHMPDGVFWWALGCLPIGVLINNPWLTLQSVLLAMVWFFMEVTVGFYPALFPIFIVGALVVLYRGPQSIMLLLATVASIGFWIEYSLAEYWRDARIFDFEAEHVAVSVGLFIFVYAFSHWLNAKNSVVAKDYGATLALWSLRFGLIFLLIMSFEDPWRDLITADWSHQSSMFVMVGLGSIAALLLSLWSVKLKVVAVMVSVYLASLLAVLFVADRGDAIVFQIVYNIILIAVGVWLIVRGIHSGISHYFFLGVASILITAFMRYVDLIGDYVGGALLFVVFAALLLGAAKYWKSYQIKEAAA